MESHSPRVERRLSTPSSTIRKPACFNRPKRAFATALPILSAILISLPGITHAQDIVIAGDISTVASLTSRSVFLSGKSELRVTNAATPLSGCTIHLDSPESWLILSQVPPDVAASDYLGQVVVNGTPAVLDQNVRVVQYMSGSVIIPQSPAYQPLEIFSGPNFTGTSVKPVLLAYHRAAELGEMNDNISSFKLKRGYMATFAQESDGTGISKVFVAQDGDMEINVMPPGLDDTVSFVRVFPWAWVGKKGWSGGIPAGGGASQLDLDWHYDWDNYVTSSRSTEYVPMRHNRGWNSWENINNKIGSTHVLGFNEPDRPDQANMSVAEAIALWPNLLASGLRLGSPAPASANWTGNADWLGQFIEQADALNYRVDYVALHFYQANFTAQSLYDYLKAIHLRTKRPIWITEMNNGANWTDSAQPNLTQAQNSTTLQAFVEIMDKAPFVERYAIYNWVGDNRALVLHDATTNADYLTPAGIMYRDHHAPLAYTAEKPPANDNRHLAFYHLDGNTQDSSGTDNNGIPIGTPQFVAGKTGQAIRLDGANDYVQLPAKVAGGADFTFAAWIKWDGGVNWQRIFDFGSDTYKYMLLTPKSAGGKLRFAITENSYQNEQALEGTALTAGVWTHVAVTIKGSTGKLFVNGTKVAENTAMTINPVNLAAYCNYLGKSQFATDPLFAGTLDEILISDTAYADTQITKMYSNTPPVFTQASFPIPDGIAGRYYRGSVASLATDTQDASAALRFAKVSGPDWVEILPDGTVHGTPSAADAGTRQLAIRVTDSAGSSTLGVASLVIHPGTSEPAAVGPVAHYRFENNTRSGIGSMHGVASGGPVYTPGVIGTAIDLDGTDDYVTLPAGVANSTAMTVAAWVRWDGGNTYQRIFDFGTGTSKYMFLTPKSGGTVGKLRFAINASAGESILETNAALTIGEWTYVAVTLDGTLGKLWVNGSEVDSEAITLTPASIMPTLNYLGKSQFTADPYFNGSIDELHIFDRALTGPELVALQAGDLHGPVFSASPLSGGTATAGTAFSGTLTTLVIDPDAGEVLTFFKLNGPPWLSVSPEGLLYGTPGAADLGPNRFSVRVVDSTGRSDEEKLDIDVTGSFPAGVAAYSFEGNALDHAGTAHGTLAGAPTFAFGRRGDAIHLSGTADSISLPAGVVNYSDITIATWVKVKSTGTYTRIFDFGAGTDKYMFLTPKSAAGTLRFAIKASSAAAEQIIEVPPLQQNEWHHVTVTLAGSTGRIYIDGEEANNGTITTDPIDLAATLNYLGKSQFAADPLFAGDLDEFQIHGRALSASEVRALYQGDVMSSAETYPEWSQRLMGAGAAPAADADGDGTSNLAEYRLGLDPTNPASTFFATMDGPVLKWPAAPGVSFRVMRSETLGSGSWEEVSRINVDTASAGWTDPLPPGDHAFYRVIFTE